MALHLHYSFLLIIFVSFNGTYESSVSPIQLTVFVGFRENFTITTKVEIKNDTELVFEKEQYVEIVAPLKFDAHSRQGTLSLIGRQAINELLLKPESCTPTGSYDCTEIIEDFHLAVRVMRSSRVASLVMVVGWAYFTAWSVSFYPQIVLNYQRKSVIGLNFDFLVLNIIGFAAYTTYNVFLFFDPNVQRQYEEAYPHSPIPVLLNDVFFAVHALIACLLTAGQVFCYERGNQRVSYICMAITASMMLVAAVAGAVTHYGTINMLQFVTILSYIKMLVTLLKYIPQAILNYRRKSTVGWSIGNILLDFTGGCLDILQMCLQSWNVSDWTAFYGNPVKFGLGLVSSLFDILFMVQHYILYPQRTPLIRTGVEKTDRIEMSDTSETEKLSGSDRQNDKTRTTETSGKSSTSQYSSKR